MTELAAEIVSSGLSVDPADVGTVEPGLVSPPVGCGLVSPPVGGGLVSPPVGTGLSDPGLDPEGGGLEPEAGVVPVGAPHSSLILAAPLVTNLKQYSSPSRPSLV